MRLHIQKPKGQEGLHSNEITFSRLNCSSKKLTNPNVKLRTGQQMNHTYYREKETIL